MPKGKFVVLEGIDGSGKSTIASALHRVLTQQGREVMHIGTSTSVQNHSVISDFISENILTGKNTFNSETQGLIFCAVLNDLIDTCIIPSLDNGTWVICERFTLSTRIYQACAPVTALTINMLDTKVTPTITIVLDIPPEIHRRRGEEANKNDFMESAHSDEIAARRRRYRQHARTRKHTHVLDGTQPVHVLVNSIIELLDV